MMPLLASQSGVQLHTGAARRVYGGDWTTDGGGV